MKPVDLVEPVVALVEQAGAAILPFWRQNLEVKHKNDESPVTVADLAANQVLGTGLQVLTPDIPVISEESCDQPLAERQGWKRWWLVDPLDGTKGFVSGGDEFAVMVALVENDKVVFGVVGVPVTGHIYWGGEGLGAWRRTRAGEPWQPIRVRQQRQGPLMVVTGRQSDDERHRRLIRGLQDALGDVERVGVSSAMKFCQLAQGQADCYPRLGPTSQWDTAAAQGVVEGAGGQVIDLQGRPFSYQMAESFLNPYFLAFPKGVDWQQTLIDLANECVKDG